MDTVILPTMTYGAEKWALKKTSGADAVAQRSMERSLLNNRNRDQIQNEVIGSKTGVKDIIERVQGIRGHSGLDM